MAEQESGKRTLWHWASWTGGVFFLFIGVIGFARGDVIPSFVVLGIAALLLPPLRNWVYAATGQQLSGRGRALAIVGLLVVLGASVPQSDETAQAPQQQAVEEPPAASGVAAEVFTKENLRSYRVFENVRPGEEFHKIERHADFPDSQSTKDGVKFVYGTMAFWDGPKKVSPGIELRANIEPRRTIGNSYLDGDCGLALGVPHPNNRDYRLPEYDNAVGEASYSWINCRHGKVSYRDRVAYVTSFVRGGVQYSVSLRTYNQGFPSDLSSLNTILEVARDWDAKIQARTKKEVRV